MKVAIFPASGKLGGSLAKHICKLIPLHDLVLVSRSPSKLDSYRDAGVTVRTADYDDPSTLESAFSGIDVLFLISYITFQHEHRSKAHKLAIDCARACGVTHIFYTSLAFAGNSDHSVAQVMQAHLDTEIYLAELASKGLYSEGFPIYTAFFNIKNPSNEIRIPHNGTGPGIAWAKIDELGEASALLLAQFYASPAEFQHKNQKLVLSGPREWSLEETAQALSRVVGKEVSIREVSVEEYIAQPVVESALSINGKKMAREWATAFDAIRHGATAVVTPFLKDILGREPEDFETTIRGMV
ncbi:hypothetical protein BDP27DRAFT_1384873 [Rhodocollybia butyracea]|uniref:NmrA-like domain-containing protein n=1 Tax=Rhodocollybia butyracea TaxID=206335 RepID=A0A9P5PKJ6_9AGAR|nr:hypothetical protein BDP27DRAFT_1384873 [Rhodocollybia butyracea]